MGGGVSLPPGSDGDNALAFVSAETRSAEDQFALDVIQKRYEDQVAAAAAKGEGDFQVTEDVLRDYGKIRDLALKEFALPLEECQCPAVVLYKYTSKTDDERKAFNDAVMAQTVDREKRRERTLKERKKLDNFDDNDKSFGGTKEDSQQEKEAAALMRGETASSKNFHADDFHIFPVLQPPLLEHNDERRPLDDAGVWKKFLGATEAGPVAMYINTLSRHIVSLRPEAYEDEVAPVAEVRFVHPSTHPPTHTMRPSPTQCAPHSARPFHPPSPATPFSDSYSHRRKRWTRPTACPKWTPPTSPSRCTPPSRSSKKLRCCWTAARSKWRAHSTSTRASART